MNNTPPSTPAPDNRERQILRAVIMDVALREGGDPTLRRGSFITEADKEALRKKVFGYQIKAPILQPYQPPLGPDRGVP